VKKVKKVTYNLAGGGTTTVEYDENVPCKICGEPILDASMGGTDICPGCDCGRCRYCGIQVPALLKEELDGGKGIKHWRDHMKWHKEHPVQGPSKPQ
jgi:hypothetical protein